jgi:hypothetical protein
MKTLDELKQDINTLQEQRNKTYEVEQGLVQEYNSVLLEKIISEKLLHKYEWEIKLSGYHIYLSSTRRDDRKVTSLMINSDYHCGIDLTDHVQLRSDDNELSIAFSDNKEIAPFIADWDLKINCSGIEKKIKSLIDEADQLNDILNLVKGRKKR